ncbi:MAG: ASCH domain-containing protein [Verrucomicrobiaceae bacterium]|nr:MAG: ASCH domain-containing protein [Verrucomicrobiaceae bacterium]
MKRYSALSIVAPGGDLICEGKKILEIRRWSPTELPLKGLLIVQNSIRLSRSGQTGDPGGRAVALVDIEDVSEWREEDLEAACGSAWEPGWLAWRLVNVRPVDCGHPVEAKLGIYEVEVPDLPWQNGHFSR